jgi:hypothetical protein
MCGSHTHGTIKNKTPINEVSWAVVAAGNQPLSEKTAAVSQVIHASVTDVPDSIEKLLVSMAWLREYQALPREKKFPYLAQKLTTVYMAKANLAFANGRAEEWQKHITTLQSELAHFEKLVTTK